MRLALAATLSPAYGIYSGYELCEHAALPGTEEYLDSEKYEIKVRDWDAPGNIKDYIARINRIRRDHPALHESRTLSFYASDDDNVLFYGKRSADGGDLVWVVVNLDPFEAHEARLELPHGRARAAAGRPPPGPRADHRSAAALARARALDPARPAQEPAAIFRVAVAKAFDDLGY